MTYIHHKTYSISLTTAHCRHNLRKLTTREKNYDGKKENKSFYLAA